MNRIGVLAVLLVLLVETCATTGRAQTIRYVDAASAAPTPTGTSWANAYPTLGAALAASVGGDQIWVAAGTYKPGTTAASTFTLLNNVALYGGFAGTETAVAQRPPAGLPSVLSGEIGDLDSYFDNCTHVITAATGATLDGFTVAFGYSVANNGGGLYNIAKGMTIRNCTFYRNYAEGTGNSAGGGAIYFDANSASGTLRIDRSRFLENSTPGSGGAIQIRGPAANFRVDNSLFVNNARGDGRWGGDIANERSVATSVGHIVNCTFLNHRWESVGSGTAGGNSAGNAGHLKLVNCVLYKEGEGTNWIGRVMNGGEITVHNCLIDGAWNIGTSVGTMNIVGTELRFTDPEFVDLTTTNLHLLSTSPCLDTGTSTTDPAIVMPTVDLDGAFRPLDGFYDMGAYEGGIAAVPPSGLLIQVR